MQSIRSCQNTFREEVTVRIGRGRLCRNEDESRLRPREVEPGVQEAQAQRWGCVRPRQVYSESVAHSWRASTQDLPGLSICVHCLP